MKALKIAVVILCVLLGLEKAAEWMVRPNRVTPEGDPPALLSTTWNQAGPYASLAPEGEIMGCWATAMAQIAFFHRLAPSGPMSYTTTSGIPISENLGAHPIYFDRIVDQIDDDTPEAAARETARYIYEVAVAIQKDFGSGDAVLDEDGFTGRIGQYLGASAELNEYSKTQYLGAREEIWELVRQEIDGRRPLLFYFDNGDDWGHAAVLDGYVEEEGRRLVHLNMGWGGDADGWYDLFDKIMGLRDDLQTRFLLTLRPE